MSLLTGKTVLVTGVRDTSSIAYQVASLAQQEGAAIVLTGQPRALAHTEAAAAELSGSVPVLPLDVTSAPDVAGLAGALRGLGVTDLHGVVHSIAFAHRTLLGGGLFKDQPGAAPAISDDDERAAAAEAEFSRVATAFQTSAYSYAALVRAALPLLRPGASVVGLTYDSRFAWPNYNWMGVNKAALEALNRYLARDLGPYNIRANLVSAGEIATAAALGIPGFREQVAEVAKRAPLPWDPFTAVPTAKAVVALLSDWFPMTTGDIVFVDGGVHAVAEWA